MVFDMAELPKLKYPEANALGGELRLVYTVQLNRQQQKNPDESFQWHNIKLEVTVNNRHRQQH